MTGTATLATWRPARPFATAGCRQPGPLASASARSGMPGDGGPSYAVDSLGDRSDAPSHSFDSAKQSRLGGRQRVPR